MSNTNEINTPNEFNNTTRKSGNVFSFSQVKKYLAKLQSPPATCGNDIPIGDQDACLNTTNMKNNESKDQQESLVNEEVITQSLFAELQSTQGQNFYMRNYPNGNDQRYLAVENDALEMTATTSEDKCKFFVSTYTDLANSLTAVAFKHVDTSKYVSAPSSTSISLVDVATEPQLFQSTDNKLFYRHYDSTLDHYYFESVTNSGYYLGYDRTTHDITLYQLTDSDIEDKMGDSLNVFFIHVTI
ncbi:uncharacterized protein [Antedon mediterranea]|uniref:uncharacterized protein n=1 Tax=Antedon mediterranea TaxID=105859 RepID=UPI003AF99643